MASAAVLSMSSAKRTTIIRPKKKVKEPEPEPEPEPVPAPTPIVVPVPLARQLVVEPYCDPELFNPQRIKRKLSIPFYKISRGVNVKELLATELAKQLEGYCSIEGYICPFSVSIYTH